MFFGTFWEHHTCFYNYHVLIISYLCAILFGGDRQIRADCGEIVLRHCRCGSRSGCYLGVYQYEQRGAGRQEEDYDGGWCVHLPDCSSTGIASVLRYRITLLR